MRGKGINYDTGFSPGGRSSRATFDPDVVRRELQIIADDLHCTAVRVSGSYPARLTVAGEHAAAAGPPGVVCAVPMRPDGRTAAAVLR